MRRCTLVEASCYEFSLPFRNRLFFYICCTRTHTRAHIYAYSEAGVIPPHEKENRRIGGTNVCLPIGTMVVAGSKVENFFHVHMKGVSISSESKFLEILTRACWRWAAFQTVLLPCTGQITNRCERTFEEREALPLIPPFTSFTSSSILDTILSLADRNIGNPLRAFNAKLSSKIDPRLVGLLFYHRIKNYLRIIARGQQVRSIDMFLVAEEFTEETLCCTQSVINNDIRE